MPRSQKTPRPPRTATTQTRRLYDTDLTDAQWAILGPLLPPPPGGGRPRTTDLREVAMKVEDVLRKKNTRIATVRMNETVAIAAQLVELRAGLHLFPVGLLVLFRRVGDGLGDSHCGLPQGGLR